MDGASRTLSPVGACGLIRAGAEPERREGVQKTPDLLVEDGDVVVVERNVPWKEQPERWRGSAASRPGIDR